MGLKLYNSLTKKKEAVIPISPDRITVYTCGMTVYDVPHVGHARTYSTWDILIRYLKFRFPDYKILHVQNYTDVGHLTDDADNGEDKIVKRAKSRDIDPMEVVDKYIRVFEEVMRKLRINTPNIAPRATGHLPEMIEFIQKLLDKDFAYQTNNGIYFDVSKFPSYGIMANIDLDGQKSSPRVELDTLKRHPYDFALFKKAEPSHIMQWSTPWDFNGFPGWHIECSTMAIKYLGETVDIHGGGIDHRSIHHPNERAQSESLTGKKFASIWIHANFMTLNNEKMSKSTGVLITASEAIFKFGADFLRFYLVTGSHYRTLEEFTLEKLKQKQDEYNRLQVMMAAVSSFLQKHEIMGTITFQHEADQFKSDFIKAMDDDLNTPKAISVLFNFENFLNNQLEEAMEDQNKSKDLSLLYKQFLELANILAIRPIPRNKIDEVLDILLELRDEARKNKNYLEADKIRDSIKKLGFKVEDKPWGSHVIKLPNFIKRD